MSSKDEALEAAFLSSACKLISLKSYLHSSNKMYVAGKPTAVEDSSQKSSGQVLSRGVHKKGGSWIYTDGHR